VHSLAVKAFRFPPTASISAAISAAERRAVPLKTMCSIKWLMPASAPLSKTEPALTHTPMLTERRLSMGSMMTRMPLLSFACLIKVLFSFFG